MKVKNIRRVFALFLALTMTLSLIAPAWAEDETSPFMIHIIRSDNSNSDVTGGSIGQNVGGTVTLSARWKQGTAPKYVRYEWTCEGGIVEFKDVDNTDVSFRTVEATVLRAPAAGSAVTITATAIDPDTNVEIANGTATCTLRLLSIPAWTTPGLTNGQELKIGETVDLTNELTSVPTNTVYEWKVTSGQDCVTLNDANKKLTGIKAGDVTITVTAKWKHEKDKCPTGKDTDHAIDTRTLNIKVPEPRVTVSPTSSTLTAGQEATLTANVTNIPDSIKESITYTWSVENEPEKDGETVVTPTSGNSSPFSVTGKAAGTATVKVVAAWSDNGTSRKLGEATATIKVNGPGLNIVGPVGDLFIGNPAPLTAKWTDGTKPAPADKTITYTWNYPNTDGKNVIKVEQEQPPLAGEIPTATVTALKAGGTYPQKATVTLTASWGSSGEKVVKELELNIAQPELAVSAKNGETEKEITEGTTTGANGTLRMQVKETVELEIDWGKNKPTIMTEGGPKIEYSILPSDQLQVVTGGAPEGAADEIKTAGTKKIQALKPTREDTPATVTITATWKEEASDVDVEATYVLNVFVSEPGLKIAEGNTTYDLSNPVVLTVDDTEEAEGTKLTAEWDYGAAPTGVPKEDIEYEWTYTVGGEAPAGNTKIIEFTPNDKAETTVTAPGSTDKEVIITVTATWGVDGKKEAKCKVKFTVPVQSIELPETFSLAMNETKTLTPKILPENATYTAITWSSSDTTVATVTAEGVIEPHNKVGKTTITATVNGVTSNACEVTVTGSKVLGLSFGISGSIVRSNSEPNPWPLEVFLSPDGGELTENIVWNVWAKEVSDPKTAVLPTLSGDGLTVTNNGHTATGSSRTVTIKNGSPGVYTVEAKLSESGHPVTIDVTISGITLTRTEVPRLLVGGSTTIAIDKVFGYADNNVGASDVDWSSDDPSTVSVMYGELTGWKLGSATITATKNGYSAQCVVAVREDEDVVAEGYDATTGKPLKLSAVYERLNQISILKTQVEDASGNLSGGYGLDYITNVIVPTSQGTLYYNYDSEANTGDGVGASDRFSMEPSGSVRSLDKLYFVPRQGFKGTAEITFNGWSINGVSFSGTIRVEVDGVENYISYRTQAGDPAFFLTGDFNTFCRAQTGRDMNYVVFNLPQASQGVLYYNYMAGSGIRVSSSTQFSKSGRYTIDDVCFVPNEAFSGDAIVTFRGADTAGESFSGSVVVSVIASGSYGDASGVYLSGGRGKPVTLQSRLFNAACQAAIQDTLSYVIFKLPTLEEGMLYYNYRADGSFDSRVNATTRYYFSGAPGINNITFVPASDAAGRIAISYTGYGTTGTTYTGTLYISLGEESRSTIQYFAPRSGHITFSSKDFNAAGLYQLGNDVDYVRFQVPVTSLGTLYYNYSSGNSTRVNSVTSYYLNPKNTQRELDLISFRARNAIGTVTIPYTAYRGTGSSQKSFSGNVVIQVGDVTPTDVRFSCKTSENVQLSELDLVRACRQAMEENLSYIEITSLPDPEAGYLYLDYSGYGTGTAVKTGDRFYCNGSPNIDQLCFVPRANFAGEVEITYIGCSGDAQEQISGRIMVDISKAQSSLFTDMAGYSWAIDSVEYLRKIGAVKGAGDGRFIPGTIITRGDFTMMIVQACGFTARGSVSFFYDVPAGTSYYAANAIRTASALGIVQGSNGYFYPMDSLTRQDAMVIIYNILTLNGKNITNGLTANLDAFHDGRDIAPYAREAMGSLLLMDVIKGNGSGGLMPRKELTRAEAAVLMHTIMTL